ncbi:hypothetical protein, partial [Rhizobium sp. S9]|uniref:hypothetical protein n=1 Tax=Rhizobium sp. S9 TaxID=2035454 RepID=UPI001AEF86BD
MVNADGKFPNGRPINSADDEAQVSENKYGFSNVNTHHVWSGRRSVATIAATELVKIRLISGACDRPSADSPHAFGGVASGAGREDDGAVAVDEG